MDMLVILLGKVKEKSLTGVKDALFRIAVKHSWETLTDKSPVYILSLVLDPRMKYAYFERNWSKVMD